MAILFGVLVCLGIVGAYCVQRWRDMAYWSERAHKLAARVDLALTPEIEPRLVRHLRRQSLLCPAAAALGYWTGRSTSSMDQSAHGGLVPGWSFGLVLGLPVALLVLGIVTTPWARWGASGTKRLAHLRHLPLRDALVTSEWLTFALAVPATAVVAEWALWRLAPTTRAWSWAVVVLVTLAEAASALWFARAILDAPSQGSDTLDLAWDDVLRLRKVRDLLLGSTLGIAAITMVVAAVTPQAGSLAEQVTLLLLSLAPFALLWYFGKNGANDAWRKLWPA